MVQVRPVRVGMAYRLMRVPVHVPYPGRLTWMLMKMVSVVVAMLVLVLQCIVRMPVRVPVEGKQDDRADE